MVERVSPTLYKSKIGYYHYCPGCKGMHHYQVTATGSPNWIFNGNVDVPDFKPSMLIWHDTDADTCKEWDIVQRCHYFINNGFIEYCSDSTHELSGKTLPLPEIPDKFSEENYGYGH